MRQPMIDVYGEEKFENLWHDWVDIFAQMPKSPDGNVDLYRKVKKNCDLSKTAKKTVLRIVI